MKTNRHRQMQHVAALWYRSIRFSKMDHQTNSRVYQNWSSCHRKAARTIIKTEWTSRLTRIHNPPTQWQEAKPPPIRHYSSGDILLKQCSQAWCTPQCLLDCETTNRESGEQKFQMPQQYDELRLLLKWYLRSKKLPVFAIDEASHLDPYQTA